MIEQSLPPIRPISLRNESDFYGFSLIVAEALGLERAPLSLNETWKHGWNAPESIRYPKQVVHWGHERDFHVVQNDFQRQFLVQQGYLNVVAAGAPFIYAESADRAKIPRSLLITPGHTLKHIPVTDNFEQFFSDLAPIRADFDEVLVCLHQESTSPEILETLRRHNLDYVLGASAHDGNSLKRVRAIFSRFESMVTNAMGSHVPYFNYCGGKTSILGPHFDFSRESLLKHDFYRDNPKILENALSWSDADVRKHYSFLYCDIREQVVHWDWAARELGHEYRRSWREAADLMGWNTGSRVRMISRHPRRALKSFLPWMQIPVLRQS